MRLDVELAADCGWNQGTRSLTVSSIQPRGSPRTLPGYGSGPLKTIGLMVLEILLKIAHVEASQRVDFLVSSAGVRKG